MPLEATRRSVATSLFSRSIVASGILAMTSAFTPNPVKGFANFLIRAQATTFRSIVNYPSGTRRYRMQHLASHALLPMTQDERAFFKAMGARIAEFRKASTITQVQLAETMDVSQQTV